MKRCPAILALTLTLAPAAQAVSPPVYCHVTVLRDYDVWLTYYAQIRLDPNCPPGGVARVRKSSTTSTKVNGAPYQPVFPLTGAWTVTAKGSDIPARARITLNSWEWQDFDGRDWKTAATR